MTRILIIEDEPQASEYLSMLIRGKVPKSEIVGNPDSVSTAVYWLENHPQPDLIFMDIQLGDGICFEIFEKTEVKCPVIFTTAYEEYALRAFKQNSIDYLLKPVKPDDLAFALNKFYERNSGSSSGAVSRLQDLISSMQYKSMEVTRSFLVPFRDKLIPVRATDIAWLGIHKGVVIATLRDERNFVIEKTLEELEGTLDPSHFFRANRQFIISREAIREVELYFNGRLLLRTIPVNTTHILISKERVPVFKKWFEQPY